MTRPALIVTVSLATAASGCATGSGAHYWDCSEGASSCKQGDVLGTVAVYAAFAVGLGIYALVTLPSRPSVHRPARPVHQPLVGHVRRDGSGKGVPAVTVSLRRADSAVVPRTTTDHEGRFQFVFPLTPGWYTVAVDAGEARGETTLWLQDRHPAPVEVRVRPPADDRPAADRRARPTIFKQR